MLTVKELLSDFKDLATTEVNGKRHYVTPEGQVYPSVTTILAATCTNKARLEEWRSAVGEEVANSVSETATKSGRFMHDCLESHVLGKPLPIPGDDPINIRGLKLYKRIAPKLVNYDILGVEIAVYSDVLKVAGRFDAIGISRKTQNLCVMDYKSSKQFKPKADCHEYFVQVAIYALAIYNMTNGKIMPTDGEILIGCDEFIDPLCYNVKLKDYMEEAKRRTNEFHSRN